jgi:hypothetical protein
LLPPHGISIDAMKAKSLWITLIVTDDSHILSGVKVSFNKMGTKTIHALVKPTHTIICLLLKEIQHSDRADAHRNAMRIL